MDGGGTAMPLLSAAVPGQGARRVAGTVLPRALPLNLAEAAGL
jgi:hypothetical protein